MTYISPTISDCVTHVKRLLNSNTRTELDAVGETLTSGTDTTLKLKYNTDGVRAGSYLSLTNGDYPPETVYVHSRNGSNVVIQRGIDGSTARGWEIDATTIEVEPRFSAHQILEAVRDSIRALPNNLYGVGSTSVTFSSTSTQAVDASALNDQDHGTPGTGFYHVLSATRTAKNNEDRLLEINVTVQRQTDGTYKVVRQEGIEKAVTVNLIYAHPFKTGTLNMDTRLDTNSGNGIGMLDSMRDIPALGAGANLLLGEESLRLDLHSQGDSRSDASVAAGDRARYSMILQGQYDRRGSEEARRLMSLYGVRAGSSGSSVFPTTLL